MGDDTHTHTHTQVHVTRSESGKAALGELGQQSAIGLATKMETSTVCVCVCVCVQGFDLELVRAVSEAVSIPVIASSGAGCPEHFTQVRPRDDTPLSTHTDTHTHAYTHTHTHFIAGPYLHA